MLNEFDAKIAKSGPNSCFVAFKLFYIQLVNDIYGPDWGRQVAEKLGAKATRMTVGKRSRKPF